MNNIDFHLAVEANDVGGDNEYDTYEIESLTIDPEAKKVLIVNYTYCWHCGDYCCSERKDDTCYAKHLANWVKEKVLKKLPGYSFGY